MSDLDLDLDAILTRAERAYAAAKNDADDLGLAELTDATRQHFNYDVPALIGTVKRLTAGLEQDRRELGRLRREMSEITDGLRAVRHHGHLFQVVSVALHDRLCTVRVATPQGTEPGVLCCNACGFCYPPIAARPEQEGTDSRG
jgi:hypothetical protein